MGKDCARAFEAARKLNALLMKNNDLVERIVNRSETISDAHIPRDSQSWRRLAARHWLGGSRGPSADDSPNEAMTKHYLEGHEVPWTEIQPGIKLAEIGRK